MGTFRDEDLTKGHPLVEVLGELVKHPSFKRIQLTGWKHEKVGNYVEQVMGTKPIPAFVERVYQHTEGNPLFITEVVRDMKEDRTVDGKAPVPEGIRTAIKRRLRRLRAR